MEVPPETPEGVARRARRLRQAVARLLHLPDELEQRIGHLRELSDRNHHLLHHLQEQQRATGDRLGHEDARLDRIQHAVAVQRAMVDQATEAAADAAHAAASLALQLAGVDPPAPVDTRVSVVLPTWQRASVVGDAIASVLAQTHTEWELLVVDDGSTDGTDEVVARYAGDDRVRYEALPHGGVSAARNHAVGLATGEVVAFLDSDNTWHPTHLARAVAALSDRPAAAWAFSGQALVDGTTGLLRLRADERGPDTLRDANFVDLNTVAVRRSALEEVGGFDTDLARLSDWDLVLRLARLGPPVRTGAVTSRYRTDLPDRIEATVPVHVLAHRVRDRYRGLPAAGLRVLLAEWHYPQVTETYIEAAVQGLLALGADVEVWAEEGVAVPFEATVPVHHGLSLEDTIAAVGPHVVLTHWLNKGRDYLPITAAAGIPHVVRTHGFEHDPVLVGHLIHSGAVVHTYGHLLDPAWADHPRLFVTPTMFDDRRFRPAPLGTKDPRLVVRTSAGLLTKDLDTFLLAANACPEHRFVLVLGHAKLVEERTEAVVARAAELGSRAEIRLDVPHDEVAAVVGEAGTYLHTHGTDHPVTMPISIAEALATGCWVLGRDLPGVAAYLGDAGTLYSGDSPEERAKAAADLLNGSLEWSPQRWADVAARASDHAFAHFAGRDVTAGMLRQWREVFDLPPARVEP